jgi:hypothetical protein
MVLIKLILIFHLMIKVNVFFQGVNKNSIIYNKLNHAANIPYLSCPVLRKESTEWELLHDKLMLSCMHFVIFNSVRGWLWFMGLNTTYNNISVISWQSVYLWRKTEKTTDKLYLILLYWMHLAWEGFELTTLVVIGTSPVYWWFIVFNTTFNNISVISWQL